MAARIMSILVALVLANLNLARAQADCNSLKPYIVRIEAGPHTAAGLLAGVDGKTAAILTAYHAVQGTTQIQVSFWNSQQQLKAASLAAYYADLDLAMLKVEFEGTRPQALFIE